MRRYELRKVQPGKGKVRSLPRLRQGDPILLRTSRLPALIINERVFFSTPAITEEV